MSVQLNHKTTSLQTKFPNGQSTHEIGFHNITEKVTGGDCALWIFNSPSKLPGGEVIYLLHELN